MDGGGAGDDGHRLSTIDSLLQGHRRLQTGAHQAAGVRTGPSPLLTSKHRLKPCIAPGALAFALDNDEIRMTNVKRIPKSEVQMERQQVLSRSFGHSRFGVLSSLVIGHSSFGFPSAPTVGARARAGSCPPWRNTFLRRTSRPRLFEVPQMV